jgi:hypothetical protein
MPAGTSCQVALPTLSRASDGSTRSQDPLEEDRSGLGRRFTNRRTAETFDPTLG